MKKNYWIIFLLFLNSLELKKIEGTGGYYKYTRTYSTCAGYRIIKEKGEVYDFHLLTRQRLKIKNKNIDTKFGFRPLFYNYKKIYYWEKNGDLVFEKSKRIKEFLYCVYTGITFIDTSRKNVKVSMDLGINILNFKLFGGERIPFPYPGVSLNLNFHDFLFPSIHFFDSPSSGIYINSLGGGTYLNLKKFEIGGYLGQKDTTYLILSFRLNSLKNTYFIANIKGPFKFSLDNKYYSNFGMGINF